MIHETTRLDVSLLVIAYELLTRILWLGRINFRGAIDGLRIIVRLRRVDGNSIYLQVVICPYDAVTSSVASVAVRPAAATLVS